MRRAPAAGGKEAAQGATRRDRHRQSAPRRGGDGFSSATALRKLSQEELRSGSSTRLGERKEKREASKESSLRNLRRPRPLTLPPSLHDCGAAADLPRGCPRKSAGVSSAAPALQTSKPLLSAPSRAGATSVRARPARKTQGRCRGAGAGPGRSLGYARRGVAGPPAVLRWVVPAGDNPEELGSSRHPSAGRSLPEATSGSAA